MACSTEKGNRDGNSASYRKLDLLISKKRKASHYQHLPHFWPGWLDRGDDRAPRLSFNGVLDNFGSILNSSIHFVENTISLPTTLNHFISVSLMWSYYLRQPVMGCYKFLILTTERILIQVPFISRPKSE